MTMPTQSARAVFAALMVFVVPLFGCDDSSKDFSESVVYPNPSDQKRFTDALTAERVPFRIQTREDGKEAIRTDPQHRDRVETIRQRLFGTAPTMGRSVSLGAAEMQRFEDALRGRGIAYEKTTYHGVGYLSWNHESDVTALSELDRIAPTAARQLREFRVLVHYK